MFAKKLAWTLCVALLLAACDAKDRCLDAGGRYHEASGVCEK